MNKKKLTEIVKNAIKEAAQGESSAESLNDLDRLARTQQPGIMSITFDGREWKIAVDRQGDIMHGKRYRTAGSGETLEEAVKDIIPYL